MSKKGQITVFIIVGIIILLISALFFYLSNQKIEPLVQNTPGELSLEGYKAPVKAQVEYCLDYTTSEAIRYVSLQGGYYQASEVYQYQFGAFIPYYYSQNKTLIPDQSKVEEELALAIKATLPTCLDQLNYLYTDKGIILSYEVEQVQVKLMNTKTIIDATVPVIISFKNSPSKEEEIVNYNQLSGQTQFTELREFHIENKIRYKKIYDSAKEIVQLQAQYPEALPLKGITKVVITDNISYKIIPAKTIISEGEDTGEAIIPYDGPDDRNSVLIALYDNQLFEKPYYFTFGLSYEVDYNEKLAKEVALEKEITTKAMELKIQ
ncbi:MAG: hypothetical protein WCV90_03025 [Candidatus Woesearchaeota archaeon]